MKKLLLHTCCAPCATFVHEWLRQNAFEATGFFYNPNIYPEAEYDLRKKCLEQYQALSGLPVIYAENDERPEAGNCADCYERRLRKCARYGRAHQFDLFSTTLLISPYQKHELIKEIGARIAQEENIGFLYHDFRAGYHKGRELAKLYNLYRQKYCGCSASLKEGKNEQAFKTAEREKVIAYS